MALPPPLDSGGEGKQRAGAQGATEAVLPERTSQGGNPEEGSESSVRDKQRDRVALWTYGKRERFFHRGSTLPPPETERCAVPSPSRPPTQPRLPPPLRAIPGSRNFPPVRDRHTAAGGGRFSQPHQATLPAPSQLRKGEAQAPPEPSTPCTVPSPHDGRRYHNRYMAR